MIDSGLVAKPMPHSLIKTSEEAVALTVGVGAARVALVTGAESPLQAVSESTEKRRIPPKEIFRICLNPFSFELKFIGQGYCYYLGMQRDSFMDTLTTIIPLKYENHEYFNFNLIEKIESNLIISIDTEYDKSKSGIEKFVQKCVDLRADLSMQILIDKFGSVGEARNAGLRNTRTPFVNFFDSDDEFFDSKIIAQSIESSEDIEVFCFGYEVLDFCNQNNYSVATPNSLTDLFSQNIGIWRFVFRRDLLLKNNLFFSEFKMGEDLLFLVNVISHNPQIKFIEEKFYRYISGRDFQATSNSKNFHESLPLMQNILESNLRTDLKHLAYWRSFLGFVKKDRALAGPCLALTIRSLKKRLLFFGKSIKSLARILWSKFA
jgi:hypothetical protein